MNEYDLTVSIRLRAYGYRDAEDYLNDLLTGLAETFVIDSIYDRGPVSGS